MSLETPIEYIKGIGPDRAKLIKNVLGIHNVEDLLNFYPIRYIDKSKIYTISELNPSLEIDIQLKGKITDLQEVVSSKGKRLSAKFRDHTGTMDLVWFRYSKWLKEQIPLNKELFIFGKIQYFNNGFSMPHPEIELDEAKALSGTLMPVYSNSEKLTKRNVTNKFFQNTIFDILKNLPQLIQENLPDSLIKSLKLMGRLDSFYNMHFPKSQQLAQQADRRLKFEEAFFFQLGFGLKKLHQHTKSVGNPFPIVGDYFNDFYNNKLPFELTNAQKRVLKEIRLDMKRATQMN